MDDDRLDRVVPSPIRREVATLHQHYSNVRYEADDRVVVLDAELGEGWSPRVVTMRIRIPQGYPRAVPRIVLPWDLRCDGTIPRQMLISGQYLVRGQLGDNILYYPASDQAETLKTLVDTVVRDLNMLCRPDETRRTADA